MEEVPSRKLMMKSEEFRSLRLRFESEAQTSIHPVSLNVIATSSCLSPPSSASAGLSFRDYTFLREGICCGFYTVAARALLAHQPLTYTHN